MLQPMHVAFVADCLEGHPSGVSMGKRFVRRLRENHTVTVLGADAASPDQVQVPRLFASLWRAQRQGFSFARPQNAPIITALKDVDVVHLHYPFWLSLVAMKEAKRKRLPIVSGFHVQPEDLLQHLRIRSHYAADWLYAYWIERLYNRSDVVICPTDFAERKLREHGLAVPTAVISNGTSSLTAHNLDARDPADQGLFLILMVGRLTPKQQHHVLLRALRHCKHRHHVKVVVAGSGPNETQLRELATFLPNKVDVGQVTQERLAELMACCDLYVHCGVVALECMEVIDAMNAGRPVLVAQSDVSAASELALDERFAFPAGDEHTLARRIDALIEQPEVRRAAGEVNQRLARRFPFEESAQKLMTTYRTAIAMKRASARSNKRLSQPTMNER